MLRQAVAIAALMLAASPALADPSFTLFQIPGADDTYAYDINAAGEVIGDFYTANNRSSFIRHTDGSLESLALRNGSPSAMNDRGDVVGNVNYKGFLRRADGTYKKISQPDVSTYLAGVNNDGTVAGYTSDRDYHTRGFMFDAGRRYQFFDLPDFSLVRAFNNTGMVAGFTITMSGNYVFLRDADGTLKTFTHWGPHAYRDLAAMNDAGVMTGNMGSSEGSELYSNPFVLTPDGTLTQFSFHGHDIVAQDINNSGTVVGYYTADHKIHGFTRALDGTVTSFDCPNALFTYAKAINDSGVIAGDCSDAQSVHSGFIRIP